jgi:hypothetical protein
MNQLSVKIRTNPLILNSINDRNYFSFKSNYLFRFKKYQKETKLTNIYSKQFLTNSPFLSNKKPVQMFFKTNYKNLLFFLHFNSPNRHNSILKNISTNSDDSMFDSKTSLNPLKKPMKFFKKNKTHFLLNKPFQPFVNPTVVNANPNDKRDYEHDYERTSASDASLHIYPPFNPFTPPSISPVYTPFTPLPLYPFTPLPPLPPFRGSRKGYTKGVYEGGIRTGYTNGVYERGIRTGYTNGVYEGEGLSETVALMPEISNQEKRAKSFVLMRLKSKFKEWKLFNFGLQKNPIKIIFNTLFLNLLKSSIQSNRIDLLNSNYIPSKIRKYLIQLYRQFSRLNQSNQYLLTQLITVNLAYSMLIVYINRHFRSEIFFNKVSFLLTFVNNFCKVKYLFLQMNRSFYYSNKDYDIFDSIQFFHRQNKNNVLSQTEFDWNLINATIFEFSNNICNCKDCSLRFLTNKKLRALLVRKGGFRTCVQSLVLQNKTMHSILIKKNFFLPIQATSKLQLMEFIKMNCAKNQCLKKYNLFHQKQVKQRNVILAEQNIPPYIPPRFLLFGGLTSKKRVGLIRKKCYTPFVYPLYPLYPLLYPLRGGKGGKEGGIGGIGNKGVKGYKGRKNFDLRKLSQEQVSNQIKLKLWKTSKKLHNQKSFNWVFKKYGSLVNFYKQVKINISWKQQPFFYKKNNSSKKSFKSILKTQNIFFFKNILKEKLDIGLPKKSLSKLLMFLIRKNSQFETLTSIEINYFKVIFLGQKNICFFKGILNLKTSHKLFLNLYQFLNFIKKQKNKYLYETYYFQN